MTKNNNNDQPTALIPRLLTAAQLATALNAVLNTEFTERSVHLMRQARRISVVRIGYRTCRYDLQKVLAELTRHEEKAIGRR